MVEISFDGKVRWVRETEKDRALVAVSFIGAPVKDLKGKRDGQFKMFVNVFFPKTFRGVMDLDYPDIVRISGRITAIDQIEDNRGFGNMIVRMTVHGYSINKAIAPPRQTVASELGVE